MQPHVIHSASKPFSPFLKKDTSDDFFYFLALLLSYNYYKVLH